jgi:hypothetical protein
MNMKSFESTELQRNAAEIQKAALAEPVFLNYQDKPRLVIMSIEEYVKSYRQPAAAISGESRDSVCAAIGDVCEHIGVLQGADWMERNRRRSEGAGAFPPISRNCISSVR